MLNSAIQRQEVHQNDYYSVVAKGPMLDRVYSMRYKSYGAEGYIEENSSLKFIDEYDGKPNSVCFLAYHRNNIVGSIRACVYDPSKGAGIPIMECFEKEIRNTIGYDNVFLEPNKFVIDPQFQRRGGIQARFLLLGTAVEEAARQKASNIVVAVRTEHIKFYQMFGGRLASEEKSYPHLNFKTVLMICDDVEKCRAFIRSKVEIIEKNDPVLNYGTV
ncbi:GNAT family N-acetyltransferase [Cellvibrio mixtus]|uniref:GNAT family N-acetyltransferase n=1 Tax=Cellvibrio mixtus TaxID=39650 RepID=UPI000586F8AF|nr:GNAT family N-acetyltransferase [Cellvibrio mixtus]